MNDEHDRSVWLLPIWFGYAIVSWTLFVMTWQATMMGPLSVESGLVAVLLPILAILSVVLARASGIRLHGLAILAFIIGVGLVFLLQACVIDYAARAV